MAVYSSLKALEILAMTIKSYYQVTKIPALIKSTFKNKCKFLFDGCNESSAATDLQC